MDDTRTPEEIERDIERERAQLAGTIDTIQDRFSVDGVVSQVGEHLKENGGEIARNISATVKQNPLGVALVGAGLAWLMLGKGPQVPQFSNSGSRDEDDRYDDDRYVGRDESHVKLGRTRTKYGQNPYDRAAAERNNARFLDDHSADMDWLYDDDDDDFDTHERSIWEGAKAYANAAGDSVAAAGSSVADAASSAKDSAVSAARSAGSTASDSAGSVKDSVTNAAQGVRDTAASAAERARLSAERTRARLSRGTENLSEAARERVIKARYSALRAKNAAGTKGRAAMDQSAEMYDRQPLAFGALAFAIGAAAAATLPRTQTEDEAVGEHSDRLMRRAQRIFEEEKSKALNVAHAAKDEAQDIVSEAKSDVDRKAPGEQSAVEAIGSKAKSAAQRIADRAAREADDQDLGKPSKAG